MHADRDGADTKSTPSARNKIDASCVFHRVSTATATRPTEREFTVEERTRTSMVVSRFLQHRLAFASLVFFVLLVLLVYLAPPLFGLDYKAVDNPPDEIGHNYLALVLRGSRQSMNIAFIVAIMSTAFGAPYGAIAAHVGGKS